MARREGATYIPDPLEHANILTETGPQELSAFLSEPSGTSHSRALEHKPTKHDSS